MFDCKCPYCKKTMDDPDECFEPEIDYEYECPHCEKNFVFTVDYMRTYSEQQADCLNGADHKYEKTKTYPPEFARLRCTMCGCEKALNT